jgi:hypothetical protein
MVNASRPSRSTSRHNDCRRCVERSTRSHGLLHEQFWKFRFIEYNGGLKINNSLLSVVLRD